MISENNLIAAGKGKVLATYLLAIAVTALVLPSAACARESVTTKLNLGDLHFFNGNIEAALASYQKAIELDPDCTECHLRLLNIYVQNGDYQEAIEQGREILRLKPAHKDALLAVGNLLRLKDDLDGAVKMFERAIEAGANPASMAHHALGLALLQKGDLNGSEEHVAEALKHQKKFPEAHLTMGVLQFKKGNKEECLEQLDKSIEEKEKNPEAHQAKGDVLSALGRWKDALSEYTKAVIDSPKLAIGWLSIGNAQIQAGDYSAAKQAFIKARKLSPSDKNAHYGLALSMEKTGDTSGAIAEFQKGLMIDDDPMMKAQVAMHIRQIGSLGTSTFNLGESSASGLVKDAAIQNPFGVSFAEMIKLNNPQVADNRSKRKESK